MRHFCSWNSDILEFFGQFVLPGTRDFLCIPMINFHPLDFFFNFGLFLPEIRDFLGGEFHDDFAFLAIPEIFISRTRVCQSRDFDT